MDLEDLRERMVMLKELAKTRALRMEGPRVPFAPIRATFLIVMVVLKLWEIAVESEKFEGCEISAWMGGARGVI